MAEFPKLRFRQVHLDFHTPEHIEGVGADFDEGQFIHALRKGNVDSVTCFALCHHGWCYYQGAKAARPHPNLKTDLLPRMLAACKEAGVDAPVYITVGWNELAAREHPEWVAVNREGRMAYAPAVDGKSPATPAQMLLADPDAPRPWGWQTLCLNTPYLDSVHAVTREVLERFKPIGLFFDITFEQECFCPFCRRRMAAEGVDPRDQAAVTAFTRRVYRDYLRKTSELVWSVAPGTRVFHNSHARKGRGDLYAYQSHYEIESLPTAEWGYDHFPQNAKYFIGKGFDMLGMTGKFHINWGEFGGFKSPAALRYECARMIALGAKCSVGDQLHPSGRMDEETYRVIGEAYAHVKEREAFCAPVSPVSDIGVLCPTSINARDRSLEKAEIGASMILSESKRLYDMIDGDADFGKYAMLVLPDACRLDGLMAAKVGAYLAAGGRLLLSAESGLAADAERFAISAGVEYAGPPEWDIDYTCVGPRVAANMVVSPFLNYKPGVRVRPLPGAEVLATTARPYFKRTYGRFASHGNTPPCGDAGYPSAVLSGRVVYIAQPVFTNYEMKGMKLHRDLVENCVSLLGCPRTAEAALPSAGTLSLMRREGGDSHEYILHLLYASPIQRGAVHVVEDIVPLRDVPVALRLPRRVRRVVEVPSGRELPVAFDGDAARLTVPCVEMHQMLRIVCD